MEDFTHLIVESDSKFLIDIITRSYKFNAHTPISIRHIHDLAILHGNIDWLILVLIKIPMMWEFKNPFKELQNLLFNDISETCNFVACCVFLGTALVNQQNK